MDDDNHLQKHLCETLRHLHSVFKASEISEATFTEKETRENLVLYINALAVNGVNFDAKTGKIRIEDAAQLMECLVRAAHRYTADLEEMAGKLGNTTKKHKPAAINSGNMTPNSENNEKLKNFVRTFKKETKLIETRFELKVCI